MVVEAHGGGWSKAARAVLGSVAKCIAATQYDSLEIVSLAIAQRLSVSLHRENARAIVRRLSDTAPSGAHDSVPAVEPGLW